jgi:hypothetical protein
LERIVVAQLHIIPPGFEYLQDWQVGPFAANPAAHGVVKNHQMGKVPQSKSRETEVRRFAQVAMD